MHKKKIEADSSRIKDEKPTCSRATLQMCPEIGYTVTNTRISAPDIS